MGIRVHSSSKTPKNLHMTINVIFHSALSIIYIPSSLLLIIAESNHQPKADRNLLESSVKDRTWTHNQWMNKRPLPPGLSRPDVAQCWLGQSVFYPTRGQHCVSKGQQLTGRTEENIRSESTFPWAVGCVTSRQKSPTVWVRPAQNSFSMCQFLIYSEPHRQRTSLIHIMGFVSDVYFGNLQCLDQLVMNIIFKEMASLQDLTCCKSILMTKTHTHTRRRTHTHTPWFVEANYFHQSFLGGRGNLFCSKGADQFLTVISDKRTEGAQGTWKVGPFVI